MKYDDAEPNIFYLEPEDEKQVILGVLNTEYDHNDGVVIVLPDQMTRVFQSPKDFHDLKLLKRKRNMPIVFVISNENLARWARMNGFTVYPSLPALIKSAKVKPSSPSSPPRIVGLQPFDDPFDDPFIPFSSGPLPAQRADYSAFLTPS